MKITTAGKSTTRQSQKAKDIAKTYGIEFIDRNGISIEKLKEYYQDDIIVVGQNRLFISPQGNQTEITFHPNIAMVRAKRIVNGEDDPFVSICKLREGMSFLDCTLGLASDSIIASLAVGSAGSVIGIESSPLLYILVKEGLSTFITGNAVIDQAMREIKAKHSDHYKFLIGLETNSIDVIYFDPMFHQTIDTSNGMNSIRKLAATTNLSEDIVNEARRVAKERIILKDHWKSNRFSKLGFTQIKRKTALFHYGTIEI